MISIQSFFGGFIFESSVLDFTELTFFYTEKILLNLFGYSLNINPSIWLNKWIW